MSIGNEGGDTVEIRNLDVAPQFLTSVNTEWPAADGPVVDVARGSADRRGFTFIVFRPPTDDVACIAFGWHIVDAPSCGYALPGTTRFSERFGSGVSSSGDRLPHAAYGLVASDVAAVRIETSTGQRVATQLVSLEPAEMDASLFFAFLPGGADAAAWVAIDATGRELERFAVGSPVHEPPLGPDPTPAAP
jgi:hypothetical protein